jgi:drug/metabolite transporter (DMT)-like permease
MAQSPIVLGTLFAVLAAVAFGVTAPLIQRLGADAGPFATAALLYLGAAMGTAPLHRRQVSPDPPFRLKHIPRILLVALFGAALAPTLFAWGLQRVPAVYGALLLNGEAVFTVILAALIRREHIGRRVAFAAAVLFAGGAVTVAGASAAGPFGSLGALAVVAGVFCWALDNILACPLSDLDPAAVVRMKALCGAALTAAMALTLHDPLPDAQNAAGLLACGAAGCGISLRLYLLAQRRIGAGRTGSVFAIAPFVGALGALVLGDRSGGFTMAIAALLFAAGLILHLTEKHSHAHIHQEMFHDHTHSHGDDHHDHQDEPLAGHHTHPHRHAVRSHSHPHGPDAHHLHAH